MGPVGACRCYSYRSFGATVGTFWGGLLGQAFCRFESIARTHYADSSRSILAGIIRRVSVGLRLLTAAILISIWLVLSAINKVVNLFKYKSADAAAKLRGPQALLTQQLGWAILWLFPRGTWGRDILMNSLYEPRDISAATTYFLKAVLKEPNDAVAHGTLGSLLMRSGEIEEALPHLSKAVELFPDDVENMYLRGFLYWLQGDILSARLDFDRSLSLWAKEEFLGQLYLLHGLTFLDKPEGVARALQDFDQAIEFEICCRLAKLFVLAICGL